MKWELSKLDFQVIVTSKFLDTPGDEVAPGSNEIREDFQYQRLGHDCLLQLGSRFKVQGSRFSPSTVDSMVVGDSKSKGFGHRVGVQFRETIRKSKKDFSRDARNDNAKRLVISNERKRP